MPLTSAAFRVNEERPPELCAGAVPAHVAIWREGVPVRRGDPVRAYLAQSHRGRR